MPSPESQATMSDAVQQRIERIVEEFAALDDLMDRYRHLIEMGDAMPGLAEEEKDEESYIPGCQYDVWIRSRYDPDAGLLHFRADSDARITRGMAALILRVLDGQPPTVVAGTDFDFLGRIGLRGQLSAQRNNGLSAMIEQVRGRAREQLNADGRGANGNGAAGRTAASTSTNDTR